MGRPLGVLSVFTGAGGLDLGLEAAGFVTRLCVENDSNAIETLKRNRPKWKIAVPCDATKFARDPVVALRKAGVKRSEIVILAGGPPCQPFSKAGNWTKHGPRRMRDVRASSTIRAYARIVQILHPEVLLFENVPGFAYRGRNEGFEAFCRSLRRVNRIYGTRYAPQLLRVNAADYGVPQMRERVFVIAHRMGRVFSMPPPTHGPTAPHAYLTAWDALGNVAETKEELAPRGRWAGLLRSIPAGKNYLWHTPGQGGKALFGWRTRYWSFLLKLSKNHPSWTISASPGPAIGPFHWQNRLLSIRELCRLQTFPSAYKIAGTRRAAQRQVGNAVPCALAELIGLEIRKQLLGQKLVSSRVSLLPGRRKRVSDPEVLSPVPRRYLVLVGDHKPHPGTGKGPARAMTRAGSLNAISL